MKFMNIYDSSVKTIGIIVQINSILKEVLIFFSSPICKRGKYLPAILLITFI